MDDLLNIILKYVEDPADAEKELERFEAGGFEAMSDSVQANLDRDEEYKAWYNRLHSIKEEEVEEGVEKDYWADYTDIGMFYLDGLGMESTLTDDQFEKLGEKIVKQLYGGDVGKAYDDIVRGKKRGTVADSAEGEKNESIKVATESFTDPLEGFPQSYKDLLNKLQRSNDRSERDMLINKMNVIRKKLKLKPLKNESVIAEADMIVESFRTRK
jgi:hypothetical protein